MSLLLVSVVIFGISLPSAILLHFQLNRAEITRTRCVERFKPVEKNCCKGSCHLKKELRKASSEPGNDQRAPGVESLELIALLPKESAAPVAPSSMRRYPEKRGAECHGFRANVDHVPWNG